MNHSRWKTARERAQAADCREHSAHSSVSGARGLSAGTLPTHRPTQRFRRGGLASASRLILYVACNAQIHHRGSMSATRIDLDDEALAAAMRELGTTTKTDTVNAALREVANRPRRLVAFRRLMARPTNPEDAADYFARREAGKG